MTWSLWGWSCPRASWCSSWREWRSVEWSRQPWWQWWRPSLNLMMDWLIQWTKYLYIKIDNIVMISWSYLHLKVHCCSSCCLVYCHPPPSSRQWRWCTARGCRGCAGWGRCLRSCSSGWRWRPWPRGVPRSKLTYPRIVFFGPPTPLLSLPSSPPPSSSSPSSPTPMTAWQESLSTKFVSD